MKIEPMTARQFKDAEPQSIGSYINSYLVQMQSMSANPIDLEKKFSKQELAQIAAALGTAARTVIALEREHEMVGFHVEYNDGSNPYCALRIPKTEAKKMLRFQLKHNRGRIEVVTIFYFDRGYNVNHTVEMIENFVK